jgi:hypothetical protein
MFRQNTAAFVHDLGSDGLANVEGESTYVRVQVLTNRKGSVRGRRSGPSCNIADRARGPCP